MKIQEKVSTSKSYELICSNATRLDHLDRFLPAELLLALNGCLYLMSNINHFWQYLIWILKRSLLLFSCMVYLLSILLIFFAQGQLLNTSRLVSSIKAKYPI